MAHPQSAAALDGFWQAPTLTDANRDDQAQR